MAIVATAAIVATGSLAAGLPARLNFVVLC